MNFLLNSEATQNGSVLFVIIGVAIVAALYVGLAFLRKYIERKQIAEQQASIPEEDDTEEIVAAITAAITHILEDEAKSEGREEAPAFRVVSFKRTNNRRIG